VDPSPLVLGHAARGWPLPDAALVCVYRCANAASVKRLIESAAVGPVALWALDATHPELYEWTFGCGAAARFQLVNRLLRSIDTHGHHLVVADDDVTMRKNGLATLLRTCAALRLDLVQPAHSARSSASYRFNRFATATLARRTGWVEQGPLLVLSPRAQSAILPFPEDLGMGWGVEALWSARSEGSFTMGIVDGVRMRHLGRIAQGYDPAAMEDQAARLSASVGVRSERDLQQNWQRWYAFQRVVPGEGRDPLAPE
jgi:hypothetical protein